MKTNCMITDTLNMNNKIILHHMVLNELGILNKDVIYCITKIQYKIGILAIQNYHKRDDNIIFVEEGHLYTILDSGIHPISVTSIIHKYFPQFDADKIITKMMQSPNFAYGKYAGKTREQIKLEWDENGRSASSLGTAMHLDIENFFNAYPINNPDSKEFLMFLDFWNDLLKQYPTIKPYRSEWVVFDEDIGLSGSIDGVFDDGYGNIIIFDWKRSKEIKMSNRFEKGFKPFDKYDNCNYSHYSLQLNFYRHMLETKYGKKVIFMALVILHPNQDKYICLQVPKIELSSVWNQLT